MDNRDFNKLPGGEFPTVTHETVVLQWPPQIPSSEAGVEYMSARLPGDGDWQIVSAHVWAKAVAGDPEVKLQDDGTDITDAETVVAGSQTELTESSAPTRLAGGSELQVEVTTDADDTIDGLVVTVVLRPYPLGEAGKAVS